jgi:hypothetical protein
VNALAAYIAAETTGSQNVQGWYFSAA